MAVKLSVNVNKIATVRNSRGGSLPSVIEAVRACIDAGAPGITVHPRADARHITTQDVHEIADELKALQGRVEYAGAWRALFAPVRELGPFTVRARNKGASDHRPFIARGVPGFNYDQEEGRGYDETYHNELDTFDHAWPREMQQAATVMAVHAHALANLPGLLPRWK